MNTSLTSGGLKVCHLPPCLSRGGGHLQNICIKALGEWTEGVPQKASRSPAPGLRTETRRLGRRGADGHLCYLFSLVRPTKVRKTACRWGPASKGGRELGSDCSLALSLSVSVRASGVLLNKKLTEGKNTATLLSLFLFFLLTECRRLYWACHDSSGPICLNYKGILLFFVKGVVHPNIFILSLFTLLNAVPNL